MAAFRIRLPGMFWLLLMAFLVVLALALNAWLPPQPRCVIPLYSALPPSIDYLSDDGRTIVITTILRLSEPTQAWDTHSGKNLGDVGSLPLPFQESEAIEEKIAKVSRFVPRAELLNTGDVEITKDGGFYSVRERVSQKSGLLQKFLGDWWPASNTDDRIVTVFETATGQIAGQLQGRYGNGHLSNDGRTMVTLYWQPDNSLSLHCWDLPLRRSLRLVFGIPLGVGLLLVLVRWRWRRRAGKLSQQSTN